MAIERRLTEIAGPVGGKLHTARSRNDQVATDLAMWVRATAREQAVAARALMGTLVDSPSAHLDWPMPGYTHLQRAQPVYLSHHLLAYVWMLARDVGRFERRRRGRRSRCRSAPARSRASTSPWTAARSPTRWASRRSPRTRSTPSPTATSRWTTWRRPRPARPTSRGWAPSSCCGPARSSASASSPTPGPRAPRSCPRRRTPTPPSCSAPRRRGSPAHLVALHGVLHGLPLTYNKDLQEDKEHLFDAADTLDLCLAAARGHAGGRDVRPRAHGGGGRRRDDRRGRTSPTCSSGGACPSARPTASWRASCARRWTPGGACPSSRVEEVRAHCDALDEEYYACSPAARGWSPRRRRAARRSRASASSSPGARARSPSGDRMDPRLLRPAGPGGRPRPARLHRLPRRRRAA